MKPLVSIIIPVKNEEHTIEKCLHSLNALHYPHYEIIVVNDGSTDNTGEILKKFDTVTVIATEARGPSVARNLAIEKSQGEYLAFTDGDCIVDTEWVNELLAYFTDAHVMGVGGDQRCPDDETPFGKEVHNFLSLIAFSSDYLKTKKRVMTVKHNPTCNMMYRRKAFQELGGFKKDLWPCEDLEFDYRLIRAGYTLIFNPKAIVYHYRPKDLPKFSRMHFRYGRAHAKLFRKYGFMAKIHYIPLILICLTIVETVLLLYKPSLALTTSLILMIVPLFYFGCRTKRMLKALTHGLLLCVTVISWTAGFIRGLVDKNIW